MTSFDDLERFAARELGRLRAPLAPASLLSGVMVQVRRAAGRPWYQHRWGQWPRRWQAASGAALFSVVGAIGGLLSLSEPGLMNSPPFPAAFGELAEIWRVAGTAFGSLPLIWRLTVQPAAAFLALLVVLMGISCTSLAAALGRLTIGGRNP